MTYHINDKGNPGICRAKNNCPFGGAEKHFATKELALKAYEKKNSALLKRFPEVKESGNFKTSSDPENIINTRILKSREKDAAQLALFRKKKDSNALLGLKDNQEFEELEIKADFWSYIERKMKEDNLSISEQTDKSFFLVKHLIKDYSLNTDPEFYSEYRSLEDIQSKTFIDLLKACGAKTSV